MPDGTMINLKVSNLRRLAEKLGVNMGGITEKWEVVQAIFAATPYALQQQDVRAAGSMVRGAREGPQSADGDKSQPMAAPQGGSAQFGAVTAIMNQPWNSAALAPEEGDMAQTMAVMEILNQPFNKDCSREQLLNTWHPIGDGAMGLAEFRFVEPGLHGPSMFYPNLNRHNLALAFRNPIWHQEEVVLEPWLVLCWCPAKYAWPYCMLCGKFCFPYAGEHTHLASHKHVQRAIKASQPHSGVQMAKWYAQQKAHPFPLYMHRG